VTARYDADPNRLEDFVTADEAETLSNNAGKAFGRDTYRIAHFVQRVAVTLRQVNRQMQLLHADVQEARATQSVRGAPTTLDPRTAAQYLTPEQLAELFDGHLRDRLRYLQAVENDAKTARTELLKMSGALKFVWSGLMEDETVPTDLKQKLAATLERAPEEVPPVADYSGGMLPPDAPATESPVEGASSVELDDLFS